MITAYTKNTDQKNLIAQAASSSLPPDVLWVDMFHPTVHDEAAVEKALDIDVPTREDMQRLEISNRLYREGEALFMTATVVAGSDTEDPASLPVTFVLTQHKLITVRYHEPRSFQIFLAQALRHLDHCENGEDILIALLETIVDRLSDPLENMSLEMDRLSRAVFQKSRDEKTDFQELLRTIGQKGDLNSRVKEALVSLDRLVSFLDYNLRNAKVKKEVQNQLKSLEQDIRSLTDHATFLSNKINFMLEAALGMINIEQNAIIKFFSVAAVIFLPPTLIASLYGMNFQHMPELALVWGYPLALFAMLLSAALPYIYFKWRGWF